MDQLFLLRAFGPTDIPELLPPVIERCRVGVLLSARQGAHDHVAKAALVGVVTIEAQAAAPA